MGIGRVRAAVAAVLLAGCGFEPLYGSSEVNADLAAVEVLPIADRSGQILRNHLRDALDRAGTRPAPRFRLDVTLRESRSELLLRADQIASRLSYTGAAYFTLSDGTRELFRGSASASTNYEVDASQYATLASRADARDRILHDIGDDIRNQLAAYFHDRRDPARRLGGPQR